MKIPNLPGYENLALYVLECRCLGRNDTVMIPMTPNTAAVMNMPAYPSTAYTAGI